MTQSKGPRAQMVRLFFGLHLYVARRVCENLQSAKISTQCKSGPVNNMVGKRNHLLQHTSITIHITLPVFTRLYTLKKLWEMLIEQTIELELRGP